MPTEFEVQSVTTGVRAGRLRRSWGEEPKVRGGVVKECRCVDGLSVHYCASWDETFGEGVVVTLEQIEICTWSGLDEAENPVDVSLECEELDIAWRLSWNEGITTVYKPWDDDNPTPLGDYTHLGSDTVVATVTEC